MPNAAKVLRLLAALWMLVAVGASRSASVSAAPHSLTKLDRILQQRSALAAGRSKVIIRAARGARADAITSLLHQHRGTPGRVLSIINARTASVPNTALAALAASPLVEHISLDRPLSGTTERTGATVGAAAVRQELGYDGAGVGVAIVDSGITSWHDDLSGATDSAQRVDRFVDLVNGRDTAYDDFGHGTHVAGIVAGNGMDSAGARSGIAPAAHLTVLKVLDATGRGFVSNAIAALDFIVANKDALNIRIANLSISAPALESYESDPLTLAAQRVVASGIVVIAAAGNAGRTSTGLTQYGAVMAPGNAPWVLTVGASSHTGTVDRADDTVAPFSSRGPGVGRASAKPDLVAPGVGIESLSAPDSAFYATRSQYLLAGTVETTYLPYLSLSGTSMSAPVVSGTVALMLQANPSLTPNQVKAILQYTAEASPAMNTLTQGAGFLNAKGAVDLARYLAAPAESTMPSAPEWGRQIIWGNQRFQGGRLSANANAWSPATIWGATATAAGDAIEWGVTCAAADCETEASSWTAWGVSSTAENVVWGSACGGLDCDASWTTDVAAGTTEADAVVWGLNDLDAVVWGLDDGDAVVWGMDDGDAVVWGMSCSDPSCEPVIWGK